MHEQKEHDTYVLSILLSPDSCLTLWHHQAEHLPGVWWCQGRGLIDWPAPWAETGSWPRWPATHQEAAAQCIIINYYDGFRVCV